MVRYLRMGRKMGFVRGEEIKRRMSLEVTLAKLVKKVEEAKLEVAGT